MELRWSLITVVPLNIPLNCPLTPTCQSDYQGADATYILKEGEYTVSKVTKFGYGIYNYDPLCYIGRGNVVVKAYVPMVQPEATLGLKGLTLEGPQTTAVETGGGIVWYAENVVMKRFYQSALQAVAGSQTFLKNVKLSNAYEGSDAATGAAITCGSSATILMDTVRCLVLV